jgi:hypothetical protein
MNFSDYKRNISIVEIAQYFGYKLNLSKGKKALEMKSNEGDTIIIFNPLDTSKQAYFNRHNSEDKGDLISFLKNRIRHISSAGEIKNDFLIIDDFLKKYHGLDTKPVMDVRIQKVDTFDISKYVIIEADINTLTYLTDQRKLTKAILKNFIDRIFSIKDTQSKYDFTNIGFPLYDLNEGKIKGFDVRNYNYKSITAGTAKGENFWFKNFAADNSHVIHLYIGESPIDLISFFQLNVRKIDMDKSCFISTSGAFGASTISKITETFPNAIFHCIYDNDFAGNLFDVITESAINNQILTYQKNGDSIILHKGEKSQSFLCSEFCVTKARAFYKPKKRIFSHKPKCYVDWNDAVRKVNYNPALK